MTLKQMLGYHLDTVNASLLGVLTRVMQAAANLTMTQHLWETT